MRPSHAIMIVVLLCTMMCHADTLTGKKGTSFQRLGTAKVEGKIIHWINCDGTKADYHLDEYSVDKGNDCNIRASAALPATGSPLPLIALAGLACLLTGGLLRVWHTHRERAR